MTAPARRFLQMRLVVEADDYEDALRFYRDVLGAAQELQVHGDGGERVTMFEELAGRRSRMTSAVCRIRRPGTRSS